MAARIFTLLDYSKKTVPNLDSSYLKLSPRDSVALMVGETKMVAEDIGPLVSSTLNATVH
jgi:hypothetical protein